MVDRAHGLRPAHQVPQHGNEHPAPSTTVDCETGWSIERIKFLLANDCRGRLSPRASAHPEILPGSPRWGARLPRGEPGFP
eukprot:scaffold130375_cov36-Phaeocystis_antarctica.AAC.1